MNQTSIGDFIQISRKNKGLTQKQLAEQINVSDKTISKWENGNSVPDTEILLSLCSALDISINELLSGEKLPPEDYSKKAEVNIMNLLQENQENRKASKWQYIVGGILIIASLILCTQTLQSRLSWYNFFDVFAFVIPACICMGVIFLSGKRSRRDVICLIKKTIIPSGAIVSLFAFISMMSTLDELETIGPNLVVCTLSLLYCCIAYLVAVVIEQHLK